MAHFAVKHFSPLRKSFSPSLRHWRHFASRFLAMRSPDSSCLYAAALWSAAAVVRYGGDVGDRADLQADRIERAHRGFAARPRALDAHFDVLDAAFLRRAPGALGGHLRGEGRRLARALEAGVARG